MKSLLSLVCAIVVVVVFSDCYGKEISKSKSSASSVTVDGEGKVVTKSKSYTSTKSSARPMSQGFIVNDPVMANTKVSSPAGHWVWVPDAHPVVSSSITMAPPVMAAPPRVMYYSRRPVQYSSPRHYSSRVYASSECPNCPMYSRTPVYSSNRTRTKSKSYSYSSSRSW